MASRRMKTAARLLAGLAILAAVLALVDLRGTADLLLHASPVLLAGGLGLLLLDRGAMALKWRVLLAAKGIRISPLCAFRLYLAGTFVSTLLPSSVGGDAWRALAAARTPQERPLTLASVLAERVLGLVGTLLVAAGAALGAVLLGFGRPAWLALATTTAILIALALMGLALLGFGGPLVAARPQEQQATALAALAARAREAGRALLSYRQEGRAVGLFLALTLLEQGLTIGAPVLFARAVGSSVPALAFFVAVPLVSILEAIPISLGGLGVREGGYVVLLGPLGMAPEAALAISLLTHAATIVLCAPGALLAVATSSRPARDGELGGEPEA